MPIACMSGAPFHSGLFGFMFDTSSKEKLNIGILKVFPVSTRVNIKSAFSLQLRT
jgi:hypothetical protein